MRLATSPYRSCAIDPTPHVQTKKEIQAALAEAGLAPQRRFGQNFLIDGNLMRRLVAAAELAAADVVLEVGAGTGGLTDLLVDAAGHVVCVEIDHGLSGLLTRRYAARDNVTLVHGDVLAGKHELNSEVMAAVQSRVPHGGSVKLVANLPYQVATPLVMNLLTEAPQVRMLCFTVQAEVGERIIARPGSKDYGPLSIATQCTCAVRQIARVPPQAFWPAPQVDSVILRLDVQEPPPAVAGRLSEFAAFVRGVFDHRRKKLRSALGYVLDDGRVARLAAVFDLSRRAEQVPVGEWVAIFATAADDRP